MKEFRKKCLDEKIPSILFVIFGIFLIIQHRFVGMYFDDYGYASISYGHDVGTLGTNFTLKDVLEYLQWHYMNWGGRVLCFFEEILSLKVGLWFIQFVQALVVWGIYLFSYLIIKTNDEKKNVKLAVLQILTYCAISISTFNRGIFWYTASVLYVWPFLALFIAVFLEKNGRGKMKKSVVIISGILLFIAGFSQEQVAAIVFVYAVISFGVYVKKEGKIRKRDVYLTTMAIGGSLIELFAPGNFARSAGDRYEDFSNLTFFQKILHNLPQILNMNLGKDNKLECFLLILSGIAVAFYFLNHKPENLFCKWNLTIQLALSLGVIGLWRVTWDVETVKIGCNIATVSGLVEFLWAMLYCANVLILLWNINRKELFALVIAAICSQGMMLIIPTIPFRCQIPFETVMHMVVVLMIVESLSGFWKKICCVILPVFGALAICNISTITYGYYNNLEIQNINHYKLLEKSAKIKQGMDIQTIVLYRMFDDNYAADMPYQQDFCEAWIKNYYELPQNVSFVWEDLNSPSMVKEVVKCDQPEIRSLYPEKIDDSVEKNADGSVNIAVVPKILSPNLKIIVNDEECETVVDQGFISTCVKKEDLINDLKICILNTDTGQKSEKVILKIKKGEE